MAMNTPRISQPLALVLFSRQFSTLVDAGVSLMRALSILKENAPPPYNQAAAEIMPPLEAGQTLSKIMGEMPTLFSPFYVKMIRVGEIGGILEESLRYLAELLEESYKITRLSGKWVLVSWILHPSCRYEQEDWSELNDRQRTFILMLFCRSVGMMLSSGVPPKLTLETAADLLPANQREAVRLVASGDLASGVSEQLARLGFLPSLVTQLMDVGEKHGAFDQMMEKAAEVYQRELHYTLL
jgi:type II secretory pathway component PulF